MAYWLALCPNSILLRQLLAERIFTDILVTFVSKSKFTWYHSFNESNQDTTFNLFLLQNISKRLRVVFTVNLCFFLKKLGWEHCTSHSRRDETRENR